MRRHPSVLMLLAVVFIWATATFALDSSRQRTFYLVAPLPLVGELDVSVSPDRIVLWHQSAGEVSKRLAVLPNPRVPIAYLWVAIAYAWVGRLGARKGWDKLR